MLKSNKGITMTSLVIYVIVLMIVITLFSTFSGYFYKNVKDITLVENSDEYYTNFIAYLTKDLNSDNIYFIKNGESKEYLIIKFKGAAENIQEHQYIYSGETIYYLDINNGKKIHLCDTVTSCSFEYHQNQNALNVNLTIQNKQYTKTYYIAV